MQHLGYKSHKKKIYIGADHAGFDLKNELIPFITRELGYEIVDCGAHQYDAADDYPDYISPVAKAVALNPEHNLGIILGGSGQGEAMVANRYPNVRAAVFYGYPGIFSNEEIIKLSREHNDANILSLGARFLNIKQAKRAVRLWLETHFSNASRHVRRIKKIEKISREIKINFDLK